MNNAQWGLNSMNNAQWENREKIKIKQISGKILIPSEYIHAQCSKCAHCFIMLEYKDKTNFKFCPNCAAEMGVE